VVDTFDISYGDPQTVQVNARRDLGQITVKYRINGGNVRSAETREWNGGLRYGDEGDYWYHRVRGQVRGTDPGDEVEVWFVSSRGNRKSRSFRYTVRSDSGADVLVLAVEDYNGNSAFPAYPGTNGPFLLDYYADALERNGHRVRRVRLRRRGSDGAGSARSAEPLRRGHLVHGQRQRHGW
jgi:hypothetical protein